MPQSSAIFAFMAAAFLIFITQRGELPAYLALLFNTAPATANPAVAAQSSTTGISAGNVASSILGGNMPGAAQAAGAGTVNSWLQSLPGIGSWFTPSTTAPAF